MSLKNAPTDIISVEIIFKDYVTFNENKIYLTEDVPEHIAEFFKEESFDKANSYIQLIKSNMKNFPNFIEDYIEKTFLPNYKSYLYYLESHTRINWTIQTIKRKDTS